MLLSVRMSAVEWQSQDFAQGKATKTLPHPQKLVQPNSEQATATNHIILLIVGIF